MKYNIQIILIYLAAGVVACQSLTQVTPPAPEKSPPPVTVKPPDPIPVKIDPIPSPPIVPPKAVASIDDLKAIGGKNSCLSYKWNERGQMPRAFAQGMTIAYARAICNQDRSDVKIVSVPPSGDKRNDVLVQYGFKTAAGLESLRKTYQLLFGLGMWESSGKHCCGKDASQNFNDADSAEAGAFQASYGARSHSPELQKLYIKYLTDKTKCYLDVFSDQVSCTSKDAKSWGSGEGTKFQELSKQCPMFSVEYAAVLSRVYGGSLGEFSTYRDKDAEVRPECEDLLKQIEKFVESSPDICKII